jgi:hypothetical protein
MTTTHFEMCPNCHKEPVYEDEHLCLDCLADERKDDDTAAYMHDRKASRHEVSANVETGPITEKYLQCGHTAQARGTIHGQDVCLMCMAGMA